MVRLGALLSIAAMIACGGDDGTVIDTPDAAVDAGPLDLSTASWELANVGDTPDSIAVRPDMAITASGEVVIVWPDQIADTPRNTPIFSVSSSAGFALETRSAAGVANYYDASITAAGERLHLVYGGSGGATNSDIFYSVREGAQWSAAINLSGPLDTNNLSDGDPTVVEVGGETIVLFTASAVTGGIEPAGVYEIRFTNPGTPTGPTMILDPADVNCTDLEAITDGSATHAVVKCTEAGTSGLFYLTDRSGSFVRQTVDLGPSRSPLTPDIAIGPNGAVHILWVGTIDCPQGTCRDVYHSRDLAPPASITGQSEDGGFMPVLGVDGLGRTIAAFHRLESFDDVLWTYSEAGGGFVRTQLATPGTADSIDWQPGAIEINPVTGHPHMAFVRSAMGNSDIIHAELR